MAFRTYDQLTVQTTAADGDLLATWRATGPLKSLTIALLRTTYLNTYYLQAANNLSDLASAPTARTNLGLGSAATKTAGTAAGNVLLLDGSGKLPAATFPALVAGQFLTNDGANLSWATSGIVTRNAHSSNYAILASDKGALLACSSSFTLTFLAAATATGVFPIYVKNVGTGSITLARTGADTIDGLTTYIMYPGEMRLFFSDGVSAWTSEVLTAFYKTWTTTDAGFVWPPGYQGVTGIGVGGGGGGSGGTSGSMCGGGGGGGVGAFFNIPAASYTAGATATITIAAGGSAGAATASGGVGGSSSVSTLATFYGGGGGSAAGGGGGGGGALSAGSTSAGTAGGAAGLADGSTGGVGVAGGTAGSGNTAFHGGAAGGGGTNTGSAAGGSNGNYGGGGGGGAGPLGASTTAGGTSVFAGAGGAGHTNAAGSDGTAPGGGGGAGGGNGSSFVGGAGARGQVTMWGVL